MDATSTNHAQNITGPTLSVVDESQDPINDPSTAPNEFKKFGGEFVHKYYKTLYHAALEGDWQRAKKFKEECPTAFTATVSAYKRTALHVAAIEGQSEFLQKLVTDMPAGAIALTDSAGYTALHYAAIDGNIKSVKALWPDILPWHKLQIAKDGLHFSVQW